MPAGSPDKVVEQPFNDLGRYSYWVFDNEDRPRLFGANHMVIPNHVHLLVKDTAGMASRDPGGTMSDRRPLQRTSTIIVRIDGGILPGKSFTRPQSKRTNIYIAVWSTSISNMVRARVVNYPAQWEHSGYREIQYPPRNHTELSILRR